MAVVLQLRLDLNTFVLAGPTTVTASAVKQAGGSVLFTEDGRAVSQATNCLTDIFTITGVPGGVPPGICGTNSGYHSKYNFTLFLTGVDITKIKIWPLHGFELYAIILKSFL